METSRRKSGLLALQHLSKVRVDIWRDRCDRRSRKKLVNCINFSGKTAKFLTKNRVLIANLFTFDVKCVISGLIYANCMIV